MYYLYTFSKNDVISCQSENITGICTLELGLELWLGLGLEFAEIRFRSNVFSSKCSRS